MLYSAKYNTLVWANVCRTDKGRRLDWGVVATLGEVEAACGIGKAAQPICHIPLTLTFGGVLGGA